MSDYEALLIFPNQLFQNHPGFDRTPSKIILIEDRLFFGDPGLFGAFHQQKIWYHRATMQRYAESLRENEADVEYVEHATDHSVLEACLQRLRTSGCSTVCVSEPHDYLLTRRLERFCERSDLQMHVLESPMFLNTNEVNRSYRDSKKRWYMADYYKFQRRRLDVLIDEDDEPVGGRWSFDEDNRKKVPAKLRGSIPPLSLHHGDAIDQAAVEHVREHYGENPGMLEELIYPTSHDAAAKWLNDFLEERLVLFGDYEDAILKGENWLWHSVLTPMLNAGLLTPRQILECTLEHAKRIDVPMNALEGFIRQLIGWREFMRATYVDHGVEMRTTNHWGHVRSIPASFYDGTTGIDPVDDVIGRMLRTGYCHHIERLMVLGGFMFLCEFDPDEIYRWFMEMFVDSYDWVMVPNVYAMSQHADGGLITTKPYFSGSSYIKKMSNHPNGDWAAIWDGLYWRWIFNHVDELAKNHRWSMMCAMARKMDPEKRAKHIQTAETFLSELER
jgi:deoxyribodipyrimidine photolyase-related protein